MTDQTSGADSSEDDDKQGAAPPADGSQGEEGKSPGKDWVKKSQFIAAINSANAKAEALEKEVAALKAAQAKPPEKPVTRADLLGLVASGDLTQEQADAVWEKQIVQRATEAARNETAAVNAVDATTRKVEAKMQQYRDLVPDVWVKGSEEHDKVGQKFRELVEEGLPSTISTELAALKLVYGEPEALRISKTAKRGSSESHQEQGGGDRDSEKPASDGMPKGLSSAQREFYEKGLKQGRYKSWADVKEELKYARKSA